ncbi:hypothetical protein, partial [Leptospira wolffii]|uniref:hypothetical protein n=1 Tax=Leptospira wolffii TaxID=409998 RepID=UPI001AEF67B9
KPIGKKGIGKLSVFGVSEHIEIETVKNRFRNTIQLVYKDIIDAKSGQYGPRLIKVDEKTKEKDGTTIKLYKLTRKSSFNSTNYLENLANNLSSRFSFFGEMNVFVLRNGKEKIQVTEKLRFARFEKEFTWEFPLTSFNNSYSEKSKIKGFVYSTEKPAPTDLSGIVLLSRGKLVNQKG